jgi:hypothetical protein
MQDKMIFLNGINRYQTHYRDRCVCQHYERG